MLTCGSPKLIAAYRVLHRQSVPWHPPCALVRLILPVHVEHYFLRLLRVVFNKDCLLYCFFPVQFSRCVEFSLRFSFPLRIAALLPFPFVSSLFFRFSFSFLFGFDPSKRYRNQSFCLSDSVDLLANFIDTLCRCCLFCKRLAGFSGFLQLMLLSCRPRI